MFDKRTLHVTAVHVSPPAAMCAAARKLGAPFASRRRPCMTWHGLLPPGSALPLSTSSRLPSALQAKPRRAFRTQEGSSGFQSAGVAREALPSRFRGLLCGGFGGSRPRALAAQSHTPRAEPADLACRCAGPDELATRFPVADH